MSSLFSGLRSRYYRNVIRGCYSYSSIVKSCSENIRLNISFKLSFAFIVGTLRRWSLIFYGTTLDPLANNSRVAETPTEAKFLANPPSSSPSSQATKVRTTTALPPSRTGRFFSFYFLIDHGTSSSSRQIEVAMSY